MANKVLVTIYGREYTIVGDRTREEIVRLAAHVDEKMNDVAGSLPDGAMSQVAVLAAVNMADEYFELKEAIAGRDQRISELEQETKKYTELWEQAKQSYDGLKSQNEQNLERVTNESKEEIRELREQKDSLLGQVNAKDREIRELMRMQEETKAEAERGSKEAVEASEQKYKEMENNFFDIQMENIQLKSELEKLKNDLEWERNERENH
ncbi:MAG: cell division protein ZapA [Anaerovoracaceae bacterium]|nr:cell division protein ZapA [Anaerovoracaceae bacterium]